jgi:hypothetical protein
MGSDFWKNPQQERASLRTRIRRRKITDELLRKKGMKLSISCKNTDLFSIHLVRRPLDDFHFTLHRSEKYSDQIVRYFERGGHENRTETGLYVIVHHPRRVELRHWLSLLRQGSIAHNIIHKYSRHVRVTAAIRQSG